MEKVQLSVRGMSCGGCVKSVTNVLSALPGVSHVEVSLEQANARVDFDPAAVSVDSMIAAVDDAGFEAAADASRA
jgi:copper chaperone